MARTLGKSSEVWMWRQLTGLQRFTPCVLAWQYINRDVFKLDGIRSHILEWDARPDEGPGRWLYRLRCLPHRNFLASVGAERRAIAHRLAEWGPNVILCQFGYMGLRLLPVARQMGIPIVVHFHGVDLSAALDRCWYRWSLSAALPHFSAIVVVGRHQHTYLTQRGVPSENVHTIPCGVPTAQFKPRRGRTPSSPVQYVAVSSLIEKKGVEYTIQAFAEVRRVRHDAQLLVVGDGPLRQGLESLVRERGLTEAVRFAGTATPAQVAAYLAQADVFVQHSIVGSEAGMEGSPVAIAEASAAGLPVVATRGCGGTEELVIDGRTGFLVEQRDVAGMARQMLRLAGDAGLRDTLGRAGREHMIANFDTATQIARLEDVLMDCCAKSGSWTIPSQKDTQAG